MTPNRLVQAVFFPLTRSSVLVTLVVFCLLSLLVNAAGMFGLWLAVIVVPAVFRYLVFLLEAQAHGSEPQPPGIEFVNVTCNAWSLFPVVIAVAVGWAAYATYNAAGTGAMLAVLVVCGFVYPAQLGVLAITHSPLQSLNPAAIHNLVRGCGASYAIAPVYLLLIAYLVSMTRQMNSLLGVFIEMFFVFSLHSVIGAIIQPQGLADDVYIPDAIEPDDKDHRADIEKDRIAALGHAYGFISRDNRQGGFAHLFNAIATDPDPAGAWSWYFSKMCGWEQQQHAMFFGQYYVQDALRHGEHVAATKAILRCRLVDETFRPFPDDLPAAIAAAEATGNAELAAVLKRP